MPPSHRELKLPCPRLTSLAQTPSIPQCTAHTQPPSRPDSGVHATDVPWQIVTRSRVRTRRAADGSLSNSLTTAVLHRQERPPKRHRNRFSALGDESSGLDAHVSNSADADTHGSMPTALSDTERLGCQSNGANQDEAPATSPCRNDDDPQTPTCTLPLMGAHDNADAPQQSQRDDASAPAELRRSKRIRAAVTASQRQPDEAVTNQDDAPTTIFCHNQARQVTSNESAVPLTNAHTHTGTAQARLLPNRHEVPITSESRRSKRIRTLTSSQHGTAAPRPNATASHAQPPRRSKRIRTAASSRHDTIASRPSCSCTTSTHWCSHTSTATGITQP